MLKKIIASVLALTMVFGAAPKGAVNVLPCSADTYAVGSFTYEDFECKSLSDGTVEIDKYKGDAAHVEIPGELEGKPVSTIGMFAFDDCVSIESVTIPKGVTIVDYGAFRNCTSLTEITIPDGVVTIGRDAFYGCTSLTSVDIPESATDIQAQAFDKTPWLSEKRSEDPLVVVNNILLDGKTCKGDITIPDGITIIAPDAFNNCWELTSVKIPDSVTRIGSTVFWDCANLKSVNIPDGIKAIEHLTFADCKALTEIKIPDSVTSIEWGAFEDCVGLTSIAIPDGVRLIDDEAFYGCSNLTNITIPDSFSECGEQIFEGTPWLEKKRSEDPLVVVNNVLVDGQTCEGNVEIPSDVKFVASKAFAGSGVTSVVVPQGVTSIGYLTFGHCRELKSVTLPGSLSTIEWYAFEDCPKLESVIIPGSVKIIENNAFIDCESLKSMTIPASVEGIWSNAIGCKHTDQLNVYERYEGFHIYCYEGTAGQSYAEKMGFDYTLIKLGDINLDGEVDSADVVKVAAHVKGVSALTYEEQARADVNGDGRVDSADVVKLAAQVKGLSAIN